MKDLLDYFKLLSDETRVRILMLLFTKELCVCQLTGITGVSQPNMSKHLGRLKDAGYVKDRRDGQYIFYSLNMENGIYSSILEDIYSNIDEYPILKEDNEKSLTADIYIDMLNAKS